MRTKKASINIITNMITYIVMLLPMFIVRKIFLNTLGDDFLGLISLYTNIINFLSIMELGIGSAIIFSLYKPYAEGDKVKIKAYIQYYKKFYNTVGIAILAIGLLLVPFLQLLIKNSVELNTARIVFVLFLINTFITYLFSHKLAILTVAQENYKISIASCISKVLISIIQIIMLKVYPSIYFYIVIEILIQLTYYILINIYISKKNEWMTTTNGHISRREKAVLTRNIKALLLHKVGGFIVSGTDNILISIFINLKSVALYNNYYLIVKAVQSLIVSLFNGLTASIGNLLVENDKKKIYITHNRIFFMNFWIVSFITISLGNTINQFIALWLGQKYVLDAFTVCIILANFYFFSMRQSIEQFKDGSGNYYQDRFSPLFESAINLISSLILIRIFGLPGVFLGTLISNLSVVFWIKPKIVYKYVFDKKLSLYFIMYFKYLFIALGTFIITCFFTQQVKSEISIGAFILNCLINIVVVNLIYCIVFFRAEEFKYFKDYIFKMVSKLIKKNVEVY